MFTTPFTFLKAATAANPIPQDGLVLAVDANDPDCYPGTGTVVTDLSPYANTGTFTDPSFSSNAFVFNTSPGNNILFNSGAQYGFSETWSYVIYVNPTDSGSTYWAEKSSTYDRGSLVYGFTSISCRPYYGGYYGMNPVSTPIGEWSFIVFTKAANLITDNYKSYRNGVLVQETTQNFAFNPITDGFQFNASIDKGNFQMKNFYCYNRALTAGEVTDIYNFVISE